MTNPAKNIAANIVATFVIGTISGVSPFVFMQLLPVMLNPSLQVEQPNYKVLIGTGLLIGAITSIIFAKTFKNYDPKDIFFYALGIPAILIASVSNMSTKFNAANQISQIKDSSSSVVLSSPTVGKIPKPEPVPPPSTLNQRSSLFSSAWAEVPKSTSNTLFAENDYLLIIGEYINAKDAWNAYTEYNNKALRTERYVPKNLGVYQLGNKFILIYGRYPNEDQAKKAFQLLRINDPEINARLVMY